METNGISSEGYSFRSRELTKLRAGFVDAGVPLLDGVVQVSPSKGYSNGGSRLEVDVVAERMIVIKHKKDIQNEVMPLRVDVMRASKANTYDRVHVFDHSVAELVLIRGRQENMWTLANEGAAVADQEALTEFIAKIAKVADKKQKDAGY